MSVIEEEIVAEIAASAAQRLTRLDPLLPGSSALEPGCGATFVVGESGSDRPTAIAACEHWAGERGSIDLTWGAARRFRLAPSIGGPKVGDALDRLLDQWRDHLAGVPEAADEDTAAIVTWPSRDADGIRTLLRHGLTPLAVIAARVTRATRDRVEAAPRLPGVQTRRAGPADIEAVTRLGLGLIRYDEQFGAVVERPETEAALRQAAAGMLADPEPWVWLAERDGAPVGLLTAERPEVAAWIAPMTNPQPVAYLQQGFVPPSERGTGIGAMLTACFHADIEAADIPVTLLHYAQTNPLSAPFWSQQGYRPLWTSWEARPARNLR